MNRLHSKGLLKSDASKRVIRHTLYYAVQHVTSIYNCLLERIAGSPT